MLEVLIIMFVYLMIGVIVVMHYGDENWGNDTELELNFKKNPILAVLSYIGLILVWPILVYLHRNI